MPLPAAATAAVASAPAAITAACAAISAAITAASAATIAAAAVAAAAAVHAAPSAYAVRFTEALAVWVLDTSRPGGVKGATNAQALLVDGALSAADEAQELRFGLIAARCPRVAAARPLNLHGALAAPAQDAAQHMLEGPQPMLVGLCARCVRFVSSAAPPRMPAVNCGTIARGLG